MVREFIVLPSPLKSPVNAVDSPIGVKEDGAVMLVARA